LDMQCSIVRCFRRASAWPSLSSIPAAAACRRLGVALAILTEGKTVRNGALRLQSRALPCRRAETPLSATGRTTELGYSRLVKPRSAATISRNMSAVRTRDTKAELILRKAIWRRGYRFRVCRRDLFGKPDLIFAGARLAVFIDGDFWHGRRLVEQGVEALRATFRTPRADWWLAKITRNVERDQEVTATLRAAGWEVVRLWERDIIKNPELVVRKIAAILRRASSAGRGSGASTLIPQRRSGSAARRAVGEAVARNPASARRPSGTRLRRLP
jgi:DNA mismatch endonuclease (patch repair protein)